MSRNHSAPNKVQLIYFMFKLNNLIYQQLTITHHYIIHSFKFYHNEQD